jgi:hypothetical protein
MEKCKNFYGAMRNKMPKEEDKKFIFKAGEKMRIFS